MPPYLHLQEQPGEEGGRLRTAFVAPAAVANMPPMSPPRHYTKFTYSTKRARERGTPLYTPSMACNPRVSVVRPLKLNQFHFAVGEDGALHSRIVAPRRDGYCPVFVETPHAAGPLLVPPATPWEALVDDIAMTDEETASLPLSVLLCRCVERLHMTPLERAKVELAWKLHQLTPEENAPLPLSAKSDPRHPAPRGASPPPASPRLASTHKGTIKAATARRDPHEHPRNLGPPPLPKRAHKKLIFSEGLQWRASSRIDTGSTKPSMP